MKAIRAVISGRVQGVGYRAWVEREARARGLAGWVRNRRDGTVEVLIAGPDSEVDALLAAFWQGPRSAQVNDVAIVPAEAPPEPGFRVLPTE